MEPSVKEILLVILGYLLIVFKSSRTQISLSKSSKGYCHEPNLQIGEYFFPVSSV
jgi:hypothetical protein